MVDGRQQRQQSDIALMQYPVSRTIGGAVGIGVVAGRITRRPPCVDFGFRIGKRERQLSVPDQCQQGFQPLFQSAGILPRNGGGCGKGSRQRFRRQAVRQHPQRHPAPWAVQTFNLLIGRRGLRRFPANPVCCCRGILHQMAAAKGALIQSFSQILKLGRRMAAQLFQQKLFRMRTRRHAKTSFVRKTALNYSGLAAFAQVFSHREPGKPADKPRNFHCAQSCVLGRFQR